MAVILKDCIKATLLSDVPDLECLCLNVTLGCQNFVLYAAYRAPDATSDYLTKLHAHMLQFNERKVILAGDFNLPGIDWERLEAGSDSVNISCMFDIMIDHNLVQVVVEPTRVTESTSSLLDLVFLHRSIAQCDVSLIPGISDHSLISVSFPLNINRSGDVNTTKAVKNFAHAQDSRIFEFLDDHVAEFCGDNVEHLWEKFKNICTFCLDKFIPNKLKKRTKFTPWVTRPILHLKRKAERLRKKRAASQRLGEVRSALHEAIQREKSFYFNTTLANFIKDDPQKFWAYISDRKKNVEQISVNGSLVSDAKAIADHFNSFFHSVFCQSSQPVAFVHDSADTPPGNLISYEGVLNMVLRIKVKSSGGPEGIPNEFFRRYAEPLSKYLVTIFEASIRTATLPKELKMARVKPIPKKGDPLLVFNYRPISIISSCSKMLEHIVTTFISKHLDEHNFLSPYQHGFRKGLSTTTQLCTVIHSLASVIDKGGQVDVIFLDFCKAFDCIPHDKLMVKLQLIGLPNFLLAWICNYLSDRSQFVCINNQNSILLPVTSGVPQGSVLGPLLFLIYCNDVVNCVNPPVNVRLFADDCILFNSITSSNDQAALQSTLNNICLWCNQWGMKLNLDKSVLLRVTNKKKPVLTDYTLSNQPLKEVKEYKYLGVTLTNNLSWNSHIKQVSSAAFRKLCMLRHKLKDAPTKVKFLAYQSLILPKLEYACVAWDPYTKTNIDALEKIQRRAVRFIYSLYKPGSSVTSVMLSNGITSLQSRRRFLRLKFLYQLSNRKFALNPDPYLTPLRTRQTRHSHALSLTPYFARTNLFKFSFFPRTIEEWNDLPASSLHSPDLIYAEI